MRSVMTSAACGLLAISIASSAGVAAADPLALYGDSIKFEVLRNGKPVGFHTTRFVRDGNGLEVRSEMSLKVPVFLLFSYQMEYRATERWRDGVLIALDVDVTRGGQEYRIDGRKDGEVFSWTGPAGPRSEPLPLIPTSHWNSVVINSSRVLNTLTGNINHVSIPREGVETVQTGDGPRMAYRYSYEGDLETDVWYDTAGRWVKLRFEASDGSIIEYRCHECGIATGA